MRRLIHGVTSALGVLVVVVAVPLFLARVAGWPLPSKMPDWSNVYWSARQNHVPAEFVVKSLAVVAWLAWAQLMWALAWELCVNVPRTLRGERAVAAPWSLGVMQRAARALVAPLMMLSSFTASPVSAAPALADLSSGAWLGTGPGASPAAVVDLGAHVEAPPEWVIQAGDTLWDVAERCLGDGSRVDEVLACNPGLTATTRLRPGETLTLPADASVPVDRAPHADPPVEAPVVAPAPADDVHVVETGESLWTIADEELGDPLRWRDVFAANEGRTFDDGRTLTNPSLIQPGWPLTIPIPTDAAPAPETEATPITEAAVDPAPTLPAEPTAPADNPAVTSVPDTTPSADTPAPAPTLPAPDAGLASPAEPPTTPPPTSAVEAAPTTSAPPATTTAPRQLEPATAGADADSDQEFDAERDLRPVNRWSDIGTPAGGVLDSSPDESAAEATDGELSTAELLTMERAAMMSAGVLVLLGARRRQRLRGAHPAARALPASPAIAATERQLRSIGTGERFARVDLAVRASALQLIAHGRRPVALIVGPDGAIDLVANGPADLAPPWVGEGVRWTLPASVPIEMLAPESRKVAAPTPTLVQLGCDGASDVYVDLEALGALQIDAPAGDGDAVIAALATTLATSVLAEVTTLIGVGVPPDAFCGHRHHIDAIDVPDALATAADAVGSTATATTSTFELRARATGGETWEPAVVLVGSAAREIALPFVPSGVAVVSASPIVGPSSVLAREHDSWILRPGGIPLTPIGLSADDVQAIAELIDVPELTPPDPLDELDKPAPAPGTPSPAVLVRLIGPVRVETAAGAVVEFERSKTRELIAWLATHRTRSTRTLARTALWESDVRDATFANVVSEARRALARAVAPPPGEEWVGRTLTEDLPLHDLVRTDADVISTALAAARSAPPAEAIAILRPAVELLDGVPFESSSYLWPDAEGITSSLVVLATSAAAELAAQYLAVGDVEGVFAATDRGLRVLPGHEELIALRMRAHARAGDHAGVRYEWESYARALAADPWSDGEPSPKLVTLRSELLGA